VFDYVKRKVVETTESPDRDYQKKHNVKRRMLSHEDHPCHQTQDQKEAAFDQNPGGTDEFLHTCGPV
jgi:hypothetical protein